MDSLTGFYSAHSGLIWFGLFAISEILSFIPAVKANGVFQAIFPFLQKKAENPDGSIKLPQ